MTWIQIDDTIYPTNTDREIIAAQEAMRKAGIEEADEFVGDPDSPDS